MDSVTATFMTSVSKIGSIALIADFLPQKRNAPVANSLNVTLDPFEWRRHGAEWRLYRERRVVGRVMPDAEWPGMWRVKLPCGLSDMVNLPRAQDAALGLAQRAESEKKLQRNQGPFSASASPMRSNRRSLPGRPSPIKKRTEAA
jgi:hypothetical protein